MDIGFHDPLLSLSEKSFLGAPINDHGKYNDMSGKLQWLTWQMKIHGKHEIS